MGIQIAANPRLFVDNCVISQIFISADGVHMLAKGDDFPS